MKSAATIFLLILLASIQTPIGQLFKLPLLVEHFIQHRNQDGVSLFGFLEDHYATNHNDADLPEDEELPFKNVKFHSIGYAILTLPVHADVPASFPGDKKIVFPNTNMPHQHLASIFHPPRV